MNKLVVRVVLSAIFLSMISCKGVKQDYQPRFESLEKVNPVPEWFKDAKFGIYFHWGVYTVPAFSNEWYPRNMNITGSRENLHHIEVFGDPSAWPYDKFITGGEDKQGNFMKFAPKLKSEGGNFDPDEWARLFADAGAKFAGPVAEHHDGFSMWASKVNPWNAKDKGPELDLVGLLADAIRKHDMKLILSMHHAYNITGFYDSVPPSTDPELQKLYGQQGKEKNEAFWLSKHKEIIDNYKPDIIWQDFNLPRITDTVLLGFLSYYYNKAQEWDREVVATYKDGLNTRVGVLDYERGGPPDITENYWLTDDAISSSSWCYTEGIGYYSKKQILHGFLDRISKNGNLLLNISPKADGTIPEEQKEVLLAMGDWLKKYGEAVYATRAWNKYGEGPTLMGSGHGVFTAPAEGTSKDVRYTRSKDNKTLYAILLGWDPGQEDILLTSLTSDRIDLSGLKSAELINGKAGEYLDLAFTPSPEGLKIKLPERSFEEMAYVIKLSFKGQIPILDRYAEIDPSPYYYIVPGNDRNNLVLSSGLMLAEQSKENSKQWKLDPQGKGYYRITGRENPANVLSANKSGSDYSIEVLPSESKDNQLWKIETSYNGFYRIRNKQYPDVDLSMDGDLSAGSEAVAGDSGKPVFGWKLKEVCESMIVAFRQLSIPGVVEAEDFNTGCPGEAYNDRDEQNSGGEYRPAEQVDIEKCSAGGFDVTRTGPGEWLTFTVNINKTGVYNVSFLTSSASDNVKLHLEYDGKDVTGQVLLPNTKGRQNWSEVKKSVNLHSGEHTLKLVFDDRGASVDKMVFKMK